MMNKDTKFRKTICSNRRGIRIHSPFIYRLVTDGLFGKTAPGGGETNLPELPGRKNKTRQILRFIRYIKPGKISVTGGPDNVAFTDIFNNSGERSTPGNNPYDLPGKCNTLHIYFKVPVPVTHFSAHDVVLLTEMNDPGARRLFVEMKSLPEVSVTLETPDLGIVFFDPLLQKEDYLIRSWFYLCGEVL